MNLAVLILLGVIVVLGAVIVAMMRRKASPPTAPVESEPKMPKTQPMVRSTTRLIKDPEHLPPDAMSLAPTVALTPETLHCDQGDLSDLARTHPVIVDPVDQVSTGLRLLQCLGTGGMASVFLAETDPTSSKLAKGTPGRVAVKIMTPEAKHELAKAGTDPAVIFSKEVIALQRISQEVPPCDFLIQFFGAGDVTVQASGFAPEPLTWIAIECVDSSQLGNDLTRRVLKGEKVDPARAARLIEGMIQGVRVLHKHGIIHRDLKPENILVVGPLDRETPKIADYGIARIEGLANLKTAGGYTQWYASPEQLASVFGERNPLIGTWTDVHALAAVCWYILGGETWCKAGEDYGWSVRGSRRSLLTSHRLHEAFTIDTSLLQKLDLVLAKGGAARLPQPLLEAFKEKTKEPAQALERYLRNVAHYEPAERYVTVEEFGQDLLPLLRQVEGVWAHRAAREKKPRTVIQAKPWQGSPEMPVRITHQPARLIRDTETGTPETIDTLVTGSMAFQTDGRVLARAGKRLYYFYEGRARKVRVDPPFAEVLSSTCRLALGPGGGYAAIDGKRIVWFQNGGAVDMPFPTREGGAGEVGLVQAVFGDGRVLVLVTGPVEDSDNMPEMWQSMDGCSWTGPSDLYPGTIRAIASGPYGYVLVGTKGKQGLAISIGLSGEKSIPKLSNTPPLTLVAAGYGRDCWAAGDSSVVRISEEGASAESIEMDGAPVAMALDQVGSPWLLTENAVYRRHSTGTWTLLYRQQSGTRLVGFGFTHKGAQVYDMHGAMVDIEPQDLSSWRKAAVAAPAQAGSP